MGVVTGPKVYRDCGAYSIVGKTGTMAAGLAAAAPFFSFRWTDTTKRALVDRINVSLASLGTGFTAGVGYFDAIFARSWTVTDNGGVTAPTMTSAVASDTGGSLAAGDYYYKVTAVGPWGESAASTESGAATVTTGSSGSVVVTYGNVSGATTHRIYRGTATGEQNVYYEDTVSTYADTGATPTGSGAPVTDGTIGGLTLTTNNAKRQTSYSTTALTSIRMSYTAALVAGTRTLDAQAFAGIQFGVSNAQNTCHLASKDGDLWRPGVEAEPLIIAANEGFVIRATVPATGTWQGVVMVDWREV